MEPAARALLDALDPVIEPWLVGTTRRVAQQAGAWSPELAADLAAAARRARQQAMGELAALLERDVDDQPTNPLALLRRAVVGPSEVLRAAGVPPVARDEFQQRAFPEDAYDLAPAAWTDIDPSVQEAGLVWGASKAYQHLARRRAEGQL